MGIEPTLRAHCAALEPGHPYLQLPVQFPISLRVRLLALVPEADLDRLVEAAKVELADPMRWDTTLTLVQAWGRVSSVAASA